MTKLEQIKQQLKEAVQVPEIIEIGCTYEKCMDELWILDEDTLAECSVDECVVFVLDAVVPAGASY